MDKLKFSYSGTAKPVFVENSTSDWMATSCGIVASAMVLRNMGKTMSGYDLRNEFHGNMPADPYTVMLANCDLNGTTINPTIGTVTVDSNSPNLLMYGNVASAFRANFTYDNTTITEKKIQDYINNYGHCLVYFNKNMNGTYPHWMVFTKYNKTGSTFANRYWVYDPAANSYSKGAHVLLSQTSDKYINMDISNVSVILAYY